jgi:hypothetical protein
MQETRIERKGRAYSLGRLIDERGVTPATLATLRLRAELSEDYFGNKPKNRFARLEQHMLDKRIERERDCVRA